ncbi:hypothetical protein ACLUWM_05475 [Limosilactobacillus mucosae]|jgi:hypothetical protein
MNFLNEVLATCVAGIVVSIVDGMYKSKKEGKVKLKGILKELEELEINSNAVVYIPGDASVIYNDYLSKIQELKSFVNSGAVKLSKKQTGNYKMLCKEVNSKLNIYRSAFAQPDDDRPENYQKYYSRYIATKPTEIQNLISKILKNQR